MKILFIFFFLIAPVLSFAEIFKCNNSGVILYSTSPCSSGSVIYKSDLVSVLTSSARSVNVPISSGGVYVLAGSLDGRGVSFMLDTGATKTTIAGSTAYEMGIRSCGITSYSNTASGLAGQCSMVISRLDVGGFVFNNVPVDISPKMIGYSLIGNDLLSRFKIQHQSGVMTISR
jgi:clan AA aspartic protease (TIGR02281 family)